MGYPATPYNERFVTACDHFREDPFFKGQVECSDLAHDLFGFEACSTKVVAWRWRNRLGVSIMFESVDSPEYLQKLLSYVPGTGVTSILPDYCWYSCLNEQFADIKKCFSNIGGELLDPDECI